MTAHALVVRLGQAAIVLVATFTVAFLLLQALPSDAVMARYASPDLGLSPEEIEEIRAAYGVDRPLIFQYLSALGGFLVGSFGYSVQTGTEVSALLATALPHTLLLAVSAFALAVVWALLIAVAGSVSSPVRGFFQSLPSFLVSLPSFWIGIILIQLVSFRLGWIPVIGASPAQALVLPAVTLSIPITAPLSQVLLRSIGEVESRPFITAL